MAGCTTLKTLEKLFEEQFYLMQVVLPSSTDGTADDGRQAAGAEQGCENVLPGIPKGGDLVNGYF